MIKKKMFIKAVSLLCFTAILATGMPEMNDVAKAATPDFYSEESSFMVDKGGFKKTVTELKNRIERKIIVTKDRSKGSKVVVEI